MGLLNAILPHPQTPPNIAPHTNILQSIGSGIATHLPYGMGLGYDVLGTIWHLINGTAGNYGPSPSLPGRLAQIFNPGFQQTSGLPASFGLPRTDADYGSPNYIGLGDPAGQTQQPQQPQGPPAPPANAAGQGLQLPIGAGFNNNDWNAWRSPFSPTFQQAMNPGSAIGPLNGMSNPYVGQFFHPTGSGSGQLGSTQAWWGNVLGGKQP